MSAETAFASPVVRKVNGRDITFKRITMAQYGQLEAAVKQKRREVERALLDEAQVPPKERIPMLREVEMRPVLIGDVICYLNSLEGTKKALAIASGDAALADETVNAVGFIDANNLVGELAGLGDDPNPPNAGETGKATQPSSASDSPAPTPAA